MAREFLSSLRSRRRQRRRCAEAQLSNAAQSHLYNLANELLNIVYQNLPLEASIALTLTSSRFYHSAIFASIRPDPKSPPETHFKALCMLEYDGSLTGYCCRGCLSKHSFAAFSCQELDKPATERYCLWTISCLRIGSRREFSFADMQKNLGISEEKANPAVRRLDYVAKLCLRPTIDIETTFHLFPWG
jgi:hypothetical protein